MNNKKEQERAELHKTIWKLADNLRGAVDGWDFKQYVLGMLFYRFISENLTDYLNREEAKSGNKDFNYADLTNEEAELGRKDTVEEKGFYILPSELFCNVRKNAKKDKNLNITLNKIFSNIENSAKNTKSEEAVRGLFDDLDLDSPKLGNTVIERNEKILKMMDVIGELNLGNDNYNNNSIDTFGDAYEYLMTMYASNAGKSGGEFFTPQEVGELLTRITVIGKKQVKKVYDPACGSGSLLLKYNKVLGPENILDGFYGQEINLTTYNLCRINMFLHNIDVTHFHITRGDTLINPAHKDDKPFDAIVSNPPYSLKWAGKSNPLLINDERYSPAGILAPESKADLAFTMHMLSWLSEDGVAAIVEFPGVLYRGGAEQKIRKYLVDKSAIDTIIQLPSNLFFGTPIATCIIVLKQNRNKNDVLFIDASNEYVKNGNKNKLSDDNINKILKLIENRQNIDNKSYLASYNEIVENDYNLAVNSYLKTVNEEEKIDIYEITRQIEEIVKKEQQTRTELEKIICDLSGEKK